MNWIITSFFMFCASIIYYLILRKATINKINYRFSNIANFSIPAVLFFILNIVQNKNMFLPYGTLFLIGLSSFFLSYLSSSASYIALAKAPNAGYSLIIQKSYAVYTSIAAIYLFHSSITPLKFIAILITLASIVFISISPNKQKIIHKDNMWIILSFIAFFGFGTLRLANKGFVNMGVPSTVLLFWTMVFVASFSILDYLIRGQKQGLKINKQDLLVLFGVGFSVTFFYYFLQISEVAAPNIGYVNVINSSSNALYTLLVAWIFKDKLTKNKLLAVITATIGIILLLV
ncbi:MAG: EamA family transporter [bacterium]|nr:EamA family transporter [bacterium]